MLTTYASRARGPDCGVCACCAILEDHEDDLLLLARYAETSPMLGDIARRIIQALK